MALYIKTSFCSFLLSIKGTHPHSLYKLKSDTDLVRPVTILAASFCNFSKVWDSCNVQPSQTIEEYSKIGKTYEI